jgi:EpsI family protein
MGSVARVRLAGLARQRRAGISLALILLALLVVFWPTLATLPDTWARYDVSHGWLVAILAGLLVWRDRDRFLDGQGGEPLLLVPLAALSLLWLVATITYVQVVHQAAFILVLVCWALATFGKRSAGTVVVIGALLLLALPLWNALIPILRPLTTVASGALVTLVRVPAVIEGDFIHIPAGTFLVADGCAGLKYFVSALVIGITYAHLMVRGWAAKLGVVAVGAAVAIVGNWIRVAILIVIGHVSDMQAAIVDDHISFGWVTFTIGLVPFFLLAGAIERRAARRSPRDRAPDGFVEHEGGSDEQHGEALRDWPRFAVASAVAALGPVTYFAIGLLPVQGDRVPSDLVALVGNSAWEAVDVPEDAGSDWRPAYLGAQQHERVSFVHGGSRVHGHRLEYRKQAQGAKLVGYPNRIAAGEEILDERVVGPVDVSGRRWVRQAVLRTPEGPLLAWYWYRVGGSEAFSPIHAKALEIPAFLARHRVSELIAFASPCDAEDCSKAFEALADLMGARRSTAAVDSASPSPQLPDGGDRF